MNKNLRYLTTGLLGAVAGAAAYYFVRRNMRAGNPPETVSEVDIQQFMGDWFDIAHYPNKWQVNTVGSMAHMSLQSDGSILAENSWFDGDFRSPRKTWHAKAWISDRGTNAKLKVQYMWPFSSDYWIIGLHPQYHWAIVSDSSREYVTILARRPALEPWERKEILSMLTLKGFDVSRLHWEAHDIQ